MIGENESKTRRDCFHYDCKINSIIVHIYAFAHAKPIASESYERIRNDAINNNNDNVNDLHRGHLIISLKVTALISDRSLAPVPVLCVKL